MAVASLPPSPSARLLPFLRRCLRGLITLAMAAALSLSLAACDGGPTKAAGPSAEDIAMITRQAQEFLAARDRLPELATLVNKRDWTFTRNLIHGPMQQVGRNMLYINKLLPAAERTEANKLANNLKGALADLDEAARLQDADALRKGYIKVASSFGLYAQVLPQQVQEALKQV
ncbi:MAG: photosystem II protein PsbQ [Cyanobacteriota bacterium]|jgi:photosystem II protein PsbQ|nr:photosystem II protein PsbQ [Cyanobacteriota bacterium]